MYQTNLNTLLSSLSSNIDRNGFYSSSEGQGSDMVNGIALCRGDVELDICRSCVNDSTRRLSQLCPNNKQAIGWYDYCMLRYSNQSFLGTMDTRPALYLWNTNNISEVDQFNQNLRNLLDGLRGRAGSGGSLRKFATGNTSFTTATDFGTIYGLVQCTPDLSEQLRSDCLIGAMQEIGSCCVGYRGGTVIYPSCKLRYELDDPFYNETTPEPPLSPPPASSVSAAASSLCQRPQTVQSSSPSVPPSLSRSSCSASASCSFVSVTAITAAPSSVSASRNIDSVSAAISKIDVPLINKRLYATAPYMEMMYGADESAATNGSKGGYGLVQCSRDINSDECKNCLGQLMENIVQCCQGKIGWRILVPICNLRYEQYPFFRQPLAPPVPVQVPEPQPLPNNEGKAGTNTTKIVLISVSAFAVVAALVGIYLYCSLGRKRTQIVQESSQVILLNNREGRTRRRFGEESMDKLVQQMDLKSMKETRMDLCGAPESFSRGIVRLALRLQ
ncbi:hypothetical protein F0562_014222 [Nyssa sinensis]|uniref:Gnk2-homologous domain-containing protein n=1 Tax=Nyssa sinensis TaxID=561372 RepID=A0A5J4ZQH8_9ASTE|nr:hypothetical protein F0562_014222 [Nyssa sinensis]